MDMYPFHILMQLSQVTFNDHQNTVTSVSQWSLLSLQRDAKANTCFDLLCHHLNLLEKTILGSICGPDNPAGKSIFKARTTGEEFG